LNICPCEQIEILAQRKSEPCNWVPFPTNSGSIEFAVTGYPDDFFSGSHSEFGSYEVFVDAYDFFGDLVDSFSETATLEPGVVDEYSYSDFNWLNGSYDVYIDNTVGGTTGADVDFFTFTGLTPGVDFSAETLAVASTSPDTFLGWFDETGSLPDTDDNGGVGFLSYLEGTVPGNGQLTFAVSGYEDDFIEGNHSEEGQYRLQLALAGGSPGDFDTDGDVDGNDFLLWQRNPSVGNLADWQANFGASSLTAAIAVPEPTSILLIFIALGMAPTAAWRRVAN